MSELFRTKAEFAYVRNISKQWIENVLSVTHLFRDLGKPNLNDHEIDNHFSKLAPSHMFATKSKSLFTLCPKEIFCVNRYPLLVYDLVYHLTFDHTDIILLSLPKESHAGFEVALKRKRRTYKREEDKRFKPPDLDQDKHQDISFFMLVKEAPPDAPYKPNPSLNRIGGNCLILQNSVSTNLFYVHADGSDLRTNPFQVGGDDMNLTSSKQSMNQSLSPKKGLPLNNKGFRRLQEKDLMKNVKMNQRSSNDAILTGADEMDHEPEIDPAPNWQHGDVILGRLRGERPEPEHKPRESNRKEKKQGTANLNEPASSMTRSKIRELMKTIRGMLQATDLPRAKPSPLVLIQA